MIVDIFNIHNWGWMCVGKSNSYQPIIANGCCIHIEGTRESISLNITITANNYDNKNTVL
jgi:hypothetical protein